MRGDALVKDIIARQARERSREDALRFIARSRQTFLAILPFVLEDEIRRGGTETPCRAAYEKARDMARAIEHYAMPDDDAYVERVMGNR